MSWTMQCHDCGHLGLPCEATEACELCGSSNIKEPLYRQVTIKAPGKDIWLATDDGHLVAKADDELCVSVAMGNYTYRLGLKSGVNAKICLDRDICVWHEGGDLVMRLGGNGFPGYLPVDEGEDI